MSLQEERNLDTESHRRGHVTMEAESGVMCLQAKVRKDCHQKLEERPRTDSSSESPGGNNPAYTLISES